MCIAVVALAYGFWVVYRKPKNNGESCCTLEKQKTGVGSRTAWLSKVFLWLGVAAVAYTFFFLKPEAEKVDDDSCCPTVNHEVKRSNSDCCGSEK